jgi:misacylated tRNA(Ala) deacylase
MGDDATARIDFDLPDADNDRIRALEPAINDVIRSDLSRRAAAPICSPPGTRVPSGS